jgi:hypothetical protein
MKVKDRADQFNMSFDKWKRSINLVLEKVTIVELDKPFDNFYLSLSPNEQA